MTTALHLVFAGLLLAAVPQQTAAMKWGLWKTQPGKLEMVRTYTSKNECMVQAQHHKDSKDGWRYYCRIS